MNWERRIKFFFMGIFFIAFGFGVLYFSIGMDIINATFLYREGVESKAYVSKEIKTGHLSAKGRRRTVVYTILKFNGGETTINRKILDDDDLYVLYELNNPSNAILGKKSEGYFKVLFRKVELIRIIGLNIFFLPMGLLGIYILFKALFIKDI